MLEFLTTLISSKTIRVSKCQERVLDIYTSFVEGLEGILNLEDWKNQEKSTFLVTIIDHFFKFLLMNAHFAPQCAIRVIQVLIYHYRTTGITTIEEYSRIENYVSHTMPISYQNRSKTTQVCANYWTAMIQCSFAKYTALSLPPPVYT